MAGKQLPAPRILSKQYVELKSQLPSFHPDQPTLPWHTQNSPTSGLSEGVFWGVEIYQCYQVESLNSGQSWASPLPQCGPV